MDGDYNSPKNFTAMAAVVNNHKKQAMMMNTLKKEQCRMQIID